MAGKTERSHDGPWWFSQSEIADILGCTTRQIRRLQQSRGFPRARGKTRGARWDIREVVQWIRADVEIGPIADEKTQLEVERLRRQIAKLDHELARMQSQVIGWDTVLEWVREFGQQVAGVVERADKACPNTCGAQVRDVLRDGLRQIEVSRRRLHARRESEGD